MTISANSLISGATALSFMDLAEMQAAMAEMEKDNLQMFIGSTGQPSFFEIEQMSNTAALNLATYQSQQQAVNGWVQAGESWGSAAFQAGGLIHGYVSAKGPNAKAEELESQKSTYKPPEMKVNIVADDPKEIEMQDMSKSNLSTPRSDAGTIDGQNSDEVKKAAEKAALEKQVKEDKRLQASADVKRTEASGIKSTSQLIGQLAGLVSTGAFKAVEGSVQQNITQAQGQGAFMQGTAELFKQVTGMTTAAIQAELGQEQAAAQAFQGIISLTGAARG
jgi:hypothetical protein